ncbi:hypothetical protein BD626DRAFT_410262 [Schizophyllum amplum]|uniref:MYND-type domain-containing protein n=1 Tax=Schizophyllum amplum TaxID=97359 RepID=A0A550C1R4_9AGAR|nr:hypothetical protein BD626DRAFT_410262 [Auriculariopsis ampla]
MFAYIKLDVFALQLSITPHKKHNECLTTVGLRIERELAKAHGSGYLTLPSSFIHSRLYKTALRGLDMTTIPEQKPYTDDDWKSVLKALDGLFSFNHILEAAFNNGSPASRAKIIKDIIPRAWEWMLFFHPDSGGYCDGDKDMLTVAATGFHWTVLGLGNSEECCLRTLIAVIFRLVRLPEGCDAMRAIPGSIRPIYSLWRAASRHAYKPIPYLDGLAACAMTACSYLCAGVEESPVRLELADEVASRGPTEGQYLSKRLRTLLEEPHNFGDILNHTQFVALIVAHREKPRPHLRGVLWLIGAAIRATEGPSAQRYAQALVSPAGKDIRHEHIRSCLRLLTDLRSELHGATDIIRLVKSGILHGLWSTLHQFPMSTLGAMVVENLDHLFKPALIFPSVVKAVLMSFARDSLEVHVPDRLGFGAWNDFGALLCERMQTATLLTKKIKDMQYCHNKECQSAGQHLRRCPCGDAFYCSKPCQAAHWSQHRDHCDQRTFASPPPLVAVPTHLHPKVPVHSTARQFDWYFIRHCAREDARRMLHLGGDCDAVVVDYTNAMGEGDTVQWLDTQSNARKTIVSAKIAMGRMITIAVFGRVHL